MTTQQAIAIEPKPADTWFALRVPSQKELRCSKILRDGGVRAVVPYERRSVRMHRNCRRKGRAKDYPTMWGYVLVAFTGPVNWYALFTDFSFINGVVCFEGSPAVLDTNQVEEFLIREDKRNFVDSPFVRKMRYKYEYEVNDMVRINTQGFADYPAKVIEIDEHSAKVLLTFLGAEREIRVPVDQAYKAA